MCGIAGAVWRDEAAADPARVVAMLSCLVHRGPDDEGMAVAGGAVLGARRLSIIDVARGHQPMGNEDGSVLAVQNGEIYNFREIRRDLEHRGHRFRTDNDTEILPHAYEEFGLDLVERLRGMFAIAIWDVPRRRLVLARDRLGKKPLFYAWADGGRTLVFGSEIQALAAFGFDRAIDDLAIADYLRYGYVPAPRTAFQAVRKIEPAHLLVLEDGVASSRRYWSVRFEPKTAVSFAEAAARLRDEIKEAVRVRLISDVPLGALLSGGLDSSTIVAFMAAQSDRRVRTFSIGFREAAYDELRYARIVADHFGTEHEELVVEPSAADVVPLLVRHFGEPFGDSSAIPTYYVAKIARQRVTVALNGDGGDELFGGYDRYRAVALGATVDRFPGAGAALGVLGAGLAPFRHWRMPARAKRLADALALAPDDRYERWVSYFSGSSFAQIVGPELARFASPGLGRPAEAADLAAARDPVDRAMAADLLTYLPGDLLVKMDIAAMANSLEGRSPLLDHHVVEFVSSLPSTYKVSILHSKRILREAMRGILPEAILHRGKMGFSVPVATWLRGPLRPLLEDTVLRPSSSLTGLLRTDRVKLIADEHLAGRADRSALLWALLMLEFWLREVPRGAARGAMSSH